MKANESGSVLLEALVALAILAAFITAMIAGVTSAFKRIAEISFDQKVEIGALAILGRVGSEFPIEIGQSTGNAGNGLMWRLTLKEAGDWPNQPTHGKILNVEIQTWHENGKGRVVNIKSLTRIRP